MFIKGKEFMKDFKYSEMMVHVPLCTHKEPNNVLIISSDAADLVTEIQKHRDDISCDVISADANALRAVEDGAYDVVISELEKDAAVLAHINRVLREEGLVVMPIDSLEDAKESNKTVMSILGKYAKIVMPYHLGNCKMALLASKEYHPTADIILQRADLTDGLEYYNSDVHPAAFAMGNHIRKAYRGIIKN
jgi:spermidine synthase